MICLQGANYLVVHNDVIVRVLIPEDLALPDNPNICHPFRCDPSHLTAPLVPECPTVPANENTPGWPQISQGHLVQERPSSDVVRVLLLVWLGSCVGLL